MNEELRLASFELDHWELESGVRRNLEAPTTFEIPDEQVRMSVKVGDTVKLIFEYDLDPESGPTSERMWVEITDRADPFLIGSLANEPILAEERHQLVLGFRIVFLPEHIVDID